MARDVGSHGGERKLDGMKRAWRNVRWVYVLGCEYVTIVIQQQNEIRCDKSETEEKRKIGWWGQVLQYRRFFVHAPITRHRERNSEPNLK